MSTVLLGLKPEFQPGHLPACTWPLGYTVISLYPTDRTSLPALLTARRPGSFLYQRRHSCVVDFGTASIYNGS